MITDPARYDAITTPIALEPAATEEPAERITMTAPIYWPSVIGGALVTASLLAVLSLLGTGLGLAAVSPWPDEGISVKTLGITAAIWLLISQGCAAALGGYLCGRLSVPWPELHHHEVYFRDTANGLIMWAVGIVVTLFILSSSTGKLLNGATQTAVLAGSSTAGSLLIRPQKEEVSAAQYLVDRLLRTDRPSPEEPALEIRGEMARILGMTLMQGNLMDEDKRYLTSIVTAHASLTPAEAEARINRVIDDARKTLAHADQLTRIGAEQTRKAGQYLTFWSVAALLTGAFCASYSAMLGGRQRDRLRAKPLSSPKLKGVTI